MAPNDNGQLDVALEALREVATMAAEQAVQSLDPEQAVFGLSPISVSAGSATEVATDISGVTHALVCELPDGQAGPCVYVSDWQGAFVPEGENWDALRALLGTNASLLLSDLSGQEVKLKDPALVEWETSKESLLDPVVRVDYELNYQNQSATITLLVPATLLAGGRKVEPQDSNDKGRETMVSAPEEKREKIEVRQPDFPEFTESEGERVPRNLEMLYDLALTVSVELGRTEMTIGQVLELGKGSIIELDKLAGDPVDLYINGRKFAEGDVVVVEDRFGVRVTSLVGKAERIESLGGGK